MTTGITPFYQGSRAVLRRLLALLYRLETEGMSHIPEKGPVIICCNHISNMDPLLLGTPLNRKVHYMAKVELFRIPVLKQMITSYGAFPVKRGGVSKESIRTAIKLLNDEKMLGIFPQGTRNQEIGMGKKGAASIALRSGATVIPAAIIGNYKLFRKMKIVFGPAVDLNTEAAKGTTDELEQVTEQIMQSIRNLTRSAG